MTIIDCVSDLHGHFPKLEGGDLLIVAGDLTARDTMPEYHDFNNWLGEQNYKKKIVISGNHDNMLKNRLPPNNEFAKKLICWGEYLCDSGTTYENLRIWGSPWTKTFEGMNPKCKAFTCDTEEELGQKFDRIPRDTDILITHSPAYGILDEVKQNPWRHGWNEDLHVGSKSLFLAVERVKPKLFVSAHIHEAYGKMMLKHVEKDTWCVNASHVNERCKPVNKPVRVIL